MQKLNLVDGARRAQVEQSGREWLERLARAGFVAKAAIYLIVSLSSLGMPLLNGFIGEFTILQGAFQVSKAWAMATRN